MYQLDSGNARPGSLDGTFRATEDEFGLVAKGSHIFPALRKVEIVLRLLLVKIWG
jgi:hypothetical protein